MLYLYVLFFALRLHTCYLSVLVTYDQRGKMRIAMALQLSVVSLLSTHALRSYILRTNDDMSEGGCQSQTVTLASVML